MDNENTGRERKLQVLTQSSLGTLQRCEELFRLKYLERLRPMEQKAYFSIGSGFHAGVEHQDPEAGVEALLKARGDSWVEKERDENLRDSWIVRAMVEGALARWSSWPANAEVEFVLPVINPETGGRSTAHDLGGVIDGVYASERSLLEMKTTSRLDEDYIQRLEIDFQVTSYLASASDLTGEPFRRVVYRIVKKPGLRPRKGETDAEHAERVKARKPLSPLKRRKEESEEDYQERSRLREAARPPLKRKVPEPIDDYGRRVVADYRERPDFYFAEVIVTRTDEDLERWRWEVWSLHRRILELERGAFPIRNTNACLDFGRCAFFDLCTGAVGTDAFNVLPPESVNPELSKLDTPNPETP